MNTHARSVLARFSGRTKLIGAAAVILAITATASAGLIPLPGGGDASPLVATMKPLASETIAPLEELNRATEAVAQRVLPTVVQIYVAGKTESQMSQQMPDNIPEPFRQFFQGPFQRQGAQPFKAWGSGIIVSPDGYIVTNNHVVKGAQNVQVTLSDQRTFNAKVVGTDSATDLAVVKVSATGLTSAAFGNSSLLKPGETVLAIGDPLGQSFSITRGIISALNRSRSGGDGPNSRGNFIQTDAAINHGNSGGPLVNIQGEVIGINTEMLTDSGASAGIGFAIPSNLVKSVAAELIKHGKVERGYLGIDVQPLTPNIAASLDEPNAHGAMVSQVNAGSPAETAGIKPYDIVTGFNGSKVANGGDLQVLAGAAAPGSKATVDVLRDGKPMQFSVTMGNFDNAPANGSAAPATGETKGSTPKLGVTVTPLTPDLRNQLQVPANVNGLAVESVQPDGPASMAGVARGDVIEQVNRHPVSNVSELQTQLAKSPAGQTILVMVSRQGNNFILSVQPQQ